MEPTKSSDKKIEILCWVRRSRNGNVSLLFPANKQRAFIRGMSMDKLLRGMTGKCYLIGFENDEVLKTGLSVQINQSGNLMIETKEGDTFFCHRSRMENVLNGTADYASFWRYLNEV